MSTIPTNPSETVRKLNPHIFGGGKTPELHVPNPPIKKRIRQSSKPVLNPLEQEWLDYSQPKFHEPIMSQSIAFRLGNGVVYWPDFVSQSFTHAWEIKGKQPIQDDSVVKIKVAARMYPKILWKLAWKQDGVWVHQTVFP